MWAIYQKKNKQKLYEIKQSSHVSDNIIRGIGGDDKGKNK